MSKVKKIDSGGTEAIRGFSYQNAIALYLLICHFQDKDFWIVPEGNDDIDVNLNNQYYKLQVKSKKLTINQLINSKQNELSVLEKVNTISDSANFQDFIPEIVCLEFSKKELDNATEDLSSLFNLSGYANDLFYCFVCLQELEKNNKYKNFDDTKQKEFIKMLEKTRILDVYKRQV